MRREAPAEAVAASLQLLEKDLSAGVLIRPELNWFDVFRHAEDLSETHAKTLGCRSLDLLHVASALLLKSEEFLTFDDRQLTLAKAAGLRIVRLIGS